MKKILSLLALLVTTVASMAADYTDVLTYTLSVLGDHSVTQTAGTLTIEDNGDGTYNVIAKNADFGSDYGNYGDIECSDVKGTTENGITTIDVTEPVSSNNKGVSMSGTSLKVKFNSEKAWAEFEGNLYILYAHRTFKYTFGTDNFPTTPDPVVEYPINFDKSATNTHSERRTSSVSLQQEGKDVQTITFNNSRSGYEDHSADEPFTVEAGSEVATTFGYNGSWMHGYVYIDLNNNKLFDVDANDLANSPELVTYSYYKGINSNGNTTDMGVNVNPPTFTAPTTPGTYRIRFKIDWDNVDPGGNGSSSNNILANGGGIWDATLVVEKAEEPEPPFTPIVRTAEDVANVTYNGTTTNYTANRVEITEYEAGKLKVTYKDLTVGDYRLGDLTIDNVTSVEEADGTERLSTTATEATWSNVSDSQIVLTLIPGETSPISGFTGILTPGAEENTIEKLNLLFNVTISGSDATVEFGDEAEIWEAVVNTYTAPANITFAGNTANFDEATLVVTEDPEDVYAVTYKNVVIAGNEIGDFTINNVAVADKEGEENVSVLTTTDTEGTWTRVVEGNALNVEQGTAVAIRNFEGTVTFDETSDDVKTIVAKFGINVTGEWADVVFGEKAEPVVPPTPDCEFTDVVDHGFTPNGAAWRQDGVAIDWDTQYIKAEIDLSTCTSGSTSPENVLGVGDDLTGWNNGPHYLFYYNATDKVLQYNYLDMSKSSLNNYANLSKAYLNAEGVVTIEISKRFGLKINGEQCLVKYVPTATNPATNGTESWTEDDIENVFGNLWAMSEIGIGGCQGATMSNATYNYIHILELPAEPVTKTFDGQLQVVDGLTDQSVVKQDEAQVVITDNGDGTGVLTFKGVSLNGQTVDLTFVGTYGGDEAEADETEDDNEFIFLAKSDAATTEFFGKEVTLECEGTVDEDANDADFSFAIAAADQSIYYIGKFAKNQWDAINSINADAATGNAQIFTIGGAKVNSLQKGINIVRTADGKTIKMVRK